MGRGTKFNTKFSLYKQQQGRCFYCLINVPKFKKGVDQSKKPLFATIDHIVPKCKNIGVPNNTVVACNKCNSDKGEKVIDSIYIEFRKRLFKEEIDPNIHDVLDRLFTCKKTTNCTTNSIHSCSTSMQEDSMSLNS